MTDQTHERETLEFGDDKGAARSTWLALVILIVVIGWMGSGFIFPSSDAEETAASGEDPDPVTVAVRKSSAESVTLFFQAEGQAQPDRDTSIRAEATGDVDDLLVAKGDDVGQGQVIARLSTDRAEADLNRAREDLAQAQREFDNANQLLDRGVATTDRVQQARASLAAAEAGVTAAEEQLESTAITAPFAGRLETLTLDSGEFVAAGSEVGRIVDNRPLTVALQVPQQSLNLIQNGQSAQVVFITGETRPGTVSFVGTSAAVATRTFLAEITVANEDGAIPAGISAEILIPTGEALAHFISPSIVSLNEEGVPGVKAVEGDVMVFHEIEVVRAEVDGIWVTGIPESADLITVGQGYVRDGEEVIAQPERELVKDASTAPEASK